VTQIRPFIALFFAAATILLLPGLTAYSQPLVFSRATSATGNYLAGREAMDGLDTHAAARFLTDAARSAWDNPTVIERAFTALVADGQIEHGADMAQHLLELDANNEMARLVLGTVALKERRYDSATKQLSGIAPGSLVGITSAILHAWSLVGAGQYDASQKLLDSVGGDSLNDFLVFHRALMADVADQHTAAIGYVTDAYTNEPYVARIVEAYVRIMANAARFADAKQALDKYDGQGLDHPIVEILRGDIEAGRRPGKLAPDSQAGAAEMFDGIGTALVNDGSSEMAAVFLRLGHYLEPKNDVITMTLADLLEGAGRYKDANAIYQGLDSASALKPEAMVRSAQNLDSLGERDEAIRHLRNIIAVDPGNLDAVGALGDLLRYAERYQEAADAYTKAIALVGGDHPGDWRYFYVRGIAYERTRQWPLAEADFLKALSLKPDQPQVLNYLGYSWVDQGTHLDKALEMIKKAIAWDPTDGYVVDSLGWAYYRLGRYDDAVQTLEQAVMLRPNDPEINDHLGDAYWRAGRRLEARFQWNIAISVDDTGNVSKRARPKLKNGLGPVSAPATDS